jgi:hypothetical protein
LLGLHQAGQERADPVGLGLELLAFGLEVFAGFLAVAVDEAAEGARQRLPGEVCALPASSRSPAGVISAFPSPWPAPMAMW